MKLTAEEQALILERRAHTTLEAKRERFYSEVISLAAIWRTWSVSTGEGLTFSTFVNQFDAPSHISPEFLPSLKLVYRALLDTLNTAASYANQLD